MASIHPSWHGIIKDNNSVFIIENEFLFLYFTLIDRKI